MKLLLVVQDVTLILTPDQMSTLVALLADAQVLTKKYMGASLPESERWKKLVTPVFLEDIKFTAMDDVSYDALKLVSTLHFEQEARK